MKVCFDGENDLMTSFFGGKVIVKKEILQAVIFSFVVGPMSYAVLGKYNAPSLILNFLKGAC